MVASGAINQYADVYGDVSGQVTATPNGNYIGISLGTPSGGNTANAGEYLIVLRRSTAAVHLYANTAASSAITNTANETAFSVGSFTLPANFLHAGDELWITGQGIATAHNGSDTLTIKLHIGGLAGATIFASAAVNVAVNDAFYFEAQLIIRAIGNASTGTFVASGVQALGTPGTATAYHFFKASTNVDTTVTEQLVASATWSAASASDSCRLDMFTVDRFAA